MTTIDPRVNLSKRTKIISEIYIADDILIVTNQVDSASLRDIMSLKETRESRVYEN